MNKKLLAVLIVFLLAILAYVNYTKRVQLAEQMGQLSVDADDIDGSDEENAAKAREIVEAVKKHIIIPGSIEPTVAAIVDVETLRRRNSFYNSAQNGDYLVITPTRAYLYDPDEDIIIDVIPVQLTPNVPPASSAPRQ